MKNYFTFILIILAQNIYTSVGLGYHMIPNYETTRLKSTAGAGWGTVLMDEASILNPASLAYYNVSSFYYQNLDADFSDRTMPKEFKDSDAWALIATDTSTSLKGSVSYIKQTFNDQKRYQMGLAIAAPMEKSSAVGISVKYIRDQYNYFDGSKNSDKFYQATFSVFHAITQAFTIGAGIVDPFNQKKEDRAIMLGVQYNFKDFIAVMLDLGTDYKGQLSDSINVKGAVQFKLFADFYFRLGAFKDDREQSTGSGYGVGWITPKLAFEFAIKNSEQTSELADIYKTNNIKDTSFSLSYRF